MRNNDYDEPILLFDELRRLVINEGYYDIEQDEYIITNQEVIDDLCD